MSAVTRVFAFGIRRRSGVCVKTSVTQMLAVPTSPWQVMIALKCRARRVVAVRNPSESCDCIWISKSSRSCTSPRHRASRLSTIRLALCSTGPILALPFHSQCQHLFSSFHDASPREQHPLCPGNDVLSGCRLWPSESELSEIP